MKSNLSIINPLNIYKENPTEFNYHNLEQAHNLIFDLMKQGIVFSKIPLIFEEKLGYTLDILFIGEYVYRFANNNFPLSKKLFECDDTGCILLKDYNGDIFVNQYWKSHLKTVSTCVDGVHFFFTPPLQQNNSHISDSTIVSSNIGPIDDVDVSTSSTDSTYKWKIIGALFIVAIVVSAKILYDYMSCKQPGKDYVVIKSNTDVIHENSNSDTVFNSSYETSFYLNDIVKLLITLCIPTFILFLYIYRYYYYYLLTIKLLKLKKALFIKF